MKHPEVASRTRWRLRPATVAVLFLVGAVLSGCASGDSDSSPSAGAPTSETSGGLQMCVGDVCKPIEEDQDVDGLFPEASATSAEEVDESPTSESGAGPVHRSTCRNASESGKPFGLVKAELRAEGAWVTVTWTTSSAPGPWDMIEYQASIGLNTDLSLVREVAEGDSIGIYRPNGRYEEISGSDFSFDCKTATAIVSRAEIAVKAGMKWSAEVFGTPTAGDFDSEVTGKCSGARIT